MSLVPQRKTVIGSGLLCCALALVVLFTGPGAFRSPSAIVVVAAIGAAAVLFQVTLRNSPAGTSRRLAIGLNLAGVLFALIALFPVPLKIGPSLVQAIALGSVVSFASGSAVLLHAVRKLPSTLK